MNGEAFLDLLSRFAGRAMPAQVGRHVYLWPGSAEPLAAAVPGPVLRTLDLHRLAGTLPGAPRAVEAARRLLADAIRAQLEALISAHGQRVVVVTGCDLLSRYQVPLTPFFEAASERVMIVFVIPAAESRFEPATPLPDYVSLSPGVPLAYLSAAVDRRAVIDSAEEVS